MKSKSRISFEDESGESIELCGKAGATILEMAVENSVEISHSCGGMGTCGTCRIELSVLRGHCPVRNDIEQEMAADRGFRFEERLSCQLECPDEPFQWIIRFKGGE